MLTKKAISFRNKGTCLINLECRHTNICTDYMQKENRFSLLTEYNEISNIKENSANN